MHTANKKSYNEDNPETRKNRTIKECPLSDKSVKQISHESRMHNRPTTHCSLHIEYFRNYLAPRSFPWKKLHFLVSKRPVGTARSDWTNRDINSLTFGPRAFLIHGEYRRGVILTCTSCSGKRRTSAYDYNWSDSKNYQVEPVRSSFWILHIWLISPKHAGEYSGMFLEFTLWISDITDSVSWLQKRSYLNRPWGCHRVRLDRV